MAPSIVVDSVSKRFTLRRVRRLQERLVRAVRGEDLSNTVQALHGVSLRVERGESVALMGLNGSGKSTLLKLISGVMPPDTGSVRVGGRVAGLIDVGAGLHPDLTGRQNIYLNAAILGMTEAEIRRKFDEIVAFAGIRRFLDTEVKFYSSGMFMRLGFSVAVHTEPDVFLIDEILAVGDPPFRRSCHARIQELRKQGHTLVIVAHDTNMLRQLCDRGIVLHEGEVVYDGGINEAAAYVADNVDRNGVSNRVR
ncbi:MAG: ATP-binding cassette domain-containing protein [Streptosporangiales bacterium]|nr:ATP-binding cassette domain-containing protein [Streptosporangiales bacterium]